MRLLLTSLLLLPLTASGTSIAIDSASAATTFTNRFAYERDIIIPQITTETSVWIPLDPHALNERSRGYEIVDGSDKPVAFKQMNDTVNLLPGATIEAAPVAAETVPKTRIEDMVDGNPETAFQPATEKEITFRVRFRTPSTPTHLVFQLSSGWIEHIRVRLGSSTATLHDAFVGTPAGTSIALSGEEASVVEVTVRTQQGVLRIAEAELLAPSTRLLIRAKPGESYLLRYGSRDSVDSPPSANVFTDINAITGSLGPVRFAGDSADADADQVADGLDNCPQFKNPGQQDRDGDTIGDACDNAPSVPNVLQKDRDEDGIGDGEDNCPDRKNADQRDDDFNGLGWVCDDTDGDGIENAADNCVGFANSDQRDLNNNRIGDACEDDRDRDGVPAQIDVCKTDFNPEQTDSDRDGIGDDCDDCPRQYDPAQSDRDQNGIGDACEQPDEEAKERDRDGDGVPDVKDNCANITNSDQTDQDGDGLGNACDNCFALRNTDQRDRNHDGTGDVCTDSDADGVLDPYDNCIAYANKTQEDRDQDNIGDPCEDDDNDGVENGRDNCPQDSNYLQTDEDKDGEGNVCDTSDDRWSEKRPWILYTSMGLIVIALVGFGGLILKRSGGQ